MWQAENRRFAIGDIHGCIRTFRYLVEEVLHFNETDTLFLLGDYIDRGPGSKETIDYIIRLMSVASVRPIMGNHEYMLLKSLEDERFFTRWRMNGCAETLVSFGATPSLAMDPASVHVIPSEYIKFFSTLPLYEDSGDFLFVHGGLDVKRENPLSDPETLLWTRNEDTPEEILGKRKLIHGHTPVELAAIQQRLDHPHTRVINLDGGCVYNRTGQGYLVALDLDGMKLYAEKNRE
jgi:serine/threonine protein phosphatase 1